MKIYEARERAAGWKITMQEGDGRQKNVMPNYGPYRNQRDAMAMVYKLRSAEKNSTGSIEMKIMASKTFCAGCYD